MFSYIVWLVLYVLSVLLANLFLDDFITLPAFGLFSIGSIFFAFIFTLRDRIHGFGLPYVYFAIFCALLVNTLYGRLVAQIEMRFLLASFVAILLGELADTSIFEYLKQSSWHKKVLGSNLVSVPLDSAAFTLLAFFGVMSAYDMLQIVFADVAGKYLLAALLAFLPFMKPVSSRALPSRAA